MRQLHVAESPGLIGVSRDGETVVVCSGDQVVLLRVSDGAELGRSNAVPLISHRHVVTVSNDAAYVLIGQGHHHFERAAHQAVLWDVTADSCRDLEGFAEVRHVDFDPTSRFAIAQSRGPRAGIFDVKTGERVWWGVDVPLLTREGHHVLVKERQWIVRRFPLGDDAPVSIAMDDDAQPLGVGTDGSFAVFARGSEQTLVRGSEEILCVRHPQRRHLRTWHGGTLIATSYTDRGAIVEVLDVGEVEPRAMVVLGNESPSAYALGAGTFVLHRGHTIRVWSYDELPRTLEP